MYTWIGRYYDVCMHEKGKGHASGQKRPIKTNTAFMKQKLQEMRSDEAGVNDKPYLMSLQ